MVDAAFFDLECEGIEPSEYMLMHYKNHKLFFKNSMSRDYLVLELESYHESFNLYNNIDSLMEESVY